MACRRCTLDGFEQNDGEDLAIGEALQPDMEEKPAIAFVGGVATFKAEGDGRGDKVNKQEGAEVYEQLFKAGG